MKYYKLIRKIKFPALYHNGVGSKIRVYIHCSDDGTDSFYAHQYSFTGYEIDRKDNSVCIKEDHVNFLIPDLVLKSFHNLLYI